MNFRYFEVNEQTIIQDKSFFSFFEKSLSSWVSQCCIQFNFWLILTSINPKIGQTAAWDRLNQSSHFGPFRAILASPVTGLVRLEHMHHLIQKKSVDSTLSNRHHVFSNFLWTRHWTQGVQCGVSTQTSIVGSTLLIRFLSKLHRNKNSIFIKKTLSDIF